MAVLITLGGVVSLAAWLIGPAKGLGIVAEEGNMPPLFDRTNRYGAPVAVLLIQALIGSAISLLYVFLPSVNQAYWILSAMTVELLCIVYILVFAAVIKLRYSQPDTPRPFRIPGGKAGVWIVGGIGLFGTAFAFIVGLMPPSYFATSGLIYIGAVLLGTFLLAVPPLVFLKFRKPSWQKSMGESRKDGHAILCAGHWKKSLGGKVTLEHGLLVFLVIMFLVPCGLLLVASHEAGYYPVPSDPAGTAVKAEGIVLTGVRDTMWNLPGATGGKTYVLADDSGNTLTIETQAFDSLESREAAIRLYNAHPVGRGKPIGSIHVIGQYMVYASPATSPIMEKVAPSLEEHAGMSGPRP
jgi:hypothetical protein